MRVKSRLFAKEGELLEFGRHSPVVFDRLDKRALAIANIEYRQIGWHQQCIATPERASPACDYEMEE